MPRLGSESNSSVRRHNPTQTLSNYFQVTSQVWQIRSSGVPRTESQAHAESSTTHTQTAEAELDVLDNLLNRTRASGSRTRWNARTFGSPYGHRPLHKWLPSEQKHFEEMSALMEMFPEPGSDEELEEEKDLHEIVAEEREAEQPEDEDEEADEEPEEDEEDGSEPEEADIGGHAESQPHLQPQSASAAKRREKNKKKRARARAKAKEKEKMKTPPPPDPVRDPPQDLLVSMSRIAQLVGSLNTDSPEESNELLQRVRDAFSEEGRRQLGSHQPSEPAQWRAEVLQSVRRMESMLGQMEKWQAQVAPGEIEALRAETARLEVRVRAVVEQKERERAEVRAASQARQARDLQITSAPSKTKDEVEVEVAVAAESSDDEGLVQLDSGGLFQAGANRQDSVGADSVSDRVAESNPSPSESDTGPTEPELDGRLLQSDKSMQPYPTLDHTPQPAATDEALLQPAPDPPPLTIVIQPAYNHPVEPTSAPPTPTSPSTSTRPPDAPVANLEATKPPSNPVTSNDQGVPKNQNAPGKLNIPPEPPADPVDYLTKHPWTMTEVLFLLEVAAHFPPSEQGWPFVAEAYNNILITRPLQEWFGKQATASNDEETRMKNTLQKMSAEARQLRARRAQEAAAQATAERGKAASFGSAEARAEANARAKHAASAGALDQDALILTRLPYPFPAPDGTAVPADNNATPPPAQRIVPFPRRRPPLSLPSEDAKAFARVMASAVAGVRPPSAESRAAMLALYSATRTRFPVRTAWDCWHRWSTPWVVQEEDPDAVWDRPPMILDYVAGNICVPLGTWLEQKRRFVYRPLPGTYPGVRGVQRRVGEFDPRVGMVAFARMAHLLAERSWAGIGLGRDVNGAVSEEVLAGRRAKLPGTLAGIWPGRSSPAKPRPAAQSATAAAQPPAAAAPAFGPSSPDSKKVRVGALPAKAPKGAPAPASSPATPSTSSVPSSTTPIPSAAATTTTPASTSTPPNTTTHPRPPFLPLPPPRPPPPARTLHVPEGTLGHATRPGMAPWFARAALRADVLEMCLGVARLRTRAGMDAVARGAGGGRSGDGDAGHAEEEEEERGRGVPLHLRRVAVPPAPELVGGALVGERLVSA